MCFGRPLRLRFDSGGCFGVGLVRRRLGFGFGLRCRLGSWFGRFDFVPREDLGVRRGGFAVLLDTGHVQCLLTCSDGFPVLSGSGICLGKECVQGTVVRRKGNGPLEVGGGPSEPAQTHVCGTTGHDRVNGLRIHGHGLCQVPDGLGVVMQCDVCQPPVVICLMMRRIQGNGFVIVGNGVLIASHFRIAGTTHGECFGDGVVVRKHLGKITYSGGVILAAEHDVGAGESCPEMIRLDFEYGVHIKQCVGVAAEAEQENRPLVSGGYQVRIISDGLVKIAERGLFFEILTVMIQLHGLVQGVGRKGLALLGFAILCRQAGACSRTGCAETACE